MKNGSRQLLTLSLLGVFLGVSTAGVARAQEADQVLAEFESGSYGSMKPLRWKTEGDAFGYDAARGARLMRKRVGTFSDHRLQKRNR